MLTEELYQSLLRDLETSITHEKNGELNRSRVIARQVAGKAIRILYSQLNLDTPQVLTPYQYLLDVQKYMKIFSPIQEEVTALTTRVNIDFSFSGKMNLITAARNILLFVKDFEE
ncbi:MAG: hypothetical protein RBT01_06200 [Anaerolineaceae bacterium]|jgi:hypothetical protein|nr:hypothetical protein [Anaerolineaceae bacterium]